MQYLISRDFPGTNWQHRAQSSAVTCCMFPKLWIKGEDFFFFSECRYHVTSLKMQCEWDFKTNFNQFPLHTFTTRKFSAVTKNGKKCPFASYVQDIKLSPIFKGSSKKKKNGYNVPREVPPKSKQHYSPQQQTSPALKSASEIPNGRRKPGFIKNTSQLYLTCA